MDDDASSAIDGNSAVVVIEFVIVVDGARDDVGDVLVATDIIGFSSVIVVGGVVAIGRRVVVVVDGVGEFIVGGGVTSASVVGVTVVIDFGIIDIADIIVGSIDAVVVVGVVGFDVVGFVGSGVAGI